MADQEVSNLRRGAFPSTHWSLVQRAGHDDSASKRRALAEIIERYLPALRCHLLYTWRLDPHSVEDLLQSFVADKFLADDMVRSAEQQRGRFRTFLLSSLNHFVAGTFRSERSLKRAPRSTQPIEEGLAVADRDPAARPDLAFDIAWARQVLAQAVEQMAAECRAGARPDVWGVFEGRVLLPTLGHAEPVPYAQLVRRYGFASPAQASNVLVTANRMFVRTLRRIVGAYACDDAEIEQEIEDLRKILAGAQGRQVGDVDYSAGVGPERE